jgi:hypothetical protein
MSRALHFSLRQLFAAMAACAIGAAILSAHPVRVPFTCLLPSPYPFATATACFALGAGVLMPGTGRKVAVRPIVFAICGYLLGAAVFTMWVQWAST